MSQEHDDSLRELFFVSSRYVEDTHHSPSGKYTLEIGGYTLVKGAGSENLPGGRELRGSHYHGRQS